MEPGNLRLNLALPLTGSMVLAKSVEFSESCPLHLQSGAMNIYAPCRVSSEPNKSKHLLNAPRRVIDE